jgi:Holliday junction resolvase-like predicted endonuclease
MTTKTQNQNIENQIEELHTQAVNKHKQNQLEDALNLYLQSIELNELQSEWIYANAITVSAQIKNYATAQSLIIKAHKIYANSSEISRASGIFFHKINHLDKAIASYQKSISLDSEQPEWVYAKLIDLLIQSKLYDHAVEVKKAAVEHFPQSKIINQQLEQKIDQSNYALNQTPTYTYTAEEKQQLFKTSQSRETPKNIEHCVDLTIRELRRKLTDSAIVERYSILLNQLLCHINEGKKEMDVDALVQCLAEIKTDIHYLKTKVLNPSEDTVDPQAQQNVELEKIIGLNKPMLVKCELKERIVGSGWYDAEEHGRWSGPGTVSSIVLPYPVAGTYKLEIVIRAESKLDLLQTLTVNLNDQTLETSILQRKNNFFPAVVRGEITIPQEKVQSFLAIDLIIDETVIPQKADSRSIGLLVERVSLIPNYTVTN